ncbi:hypothetical protein evm_012267 [Chilo suppressalis]|nr:hypothetical protein evm_012267 [Chilo suppressalis]
MASESSSAVLDLNDGDATEDTEPPSATDDDGDPLIMEHGYDIAVKVDAPLKQMSTLETYVTYRVRCVCARWPSPKYVRRRYNHFRALHKRLSSSHPLIATPPLPPLHSARQQLDRYCPAFVCVRTMALHAFLDRVAKHPILTHSEDLRVFLTTPDEDPEKLLKSDGGLALWGLSAFTGDRPANGPRVKDPEFTSAAEYLTSLQQKLTALCALTVALHKGEAATGNELMGMKRVCDAWASQAGGLAGKGAGALGTGAGVASQARGGGTKGGANGKVAALRARATLPLLAAYAQAHVDKIRQRDAMHATYVSGSNATGELHNRLEQASEALRSELSDWIPKTRSEIKSLLLEIAEHQVSVHKQTLMGWEHALKLSTEADVGELFKTVSKNAVQNLSPSKYNANLSETERDFDDLESNSSADLSKDHDLDVANLKLDAGSSKGTDSPENYEVVKENSEVFDNIEALGDKKSSTESYEVVKDVANVNGEVCKVRLKSEDEVRSDPLTDFSEVDLSS